MGGALRQRGYLALYGAPPNPTAGAEIAEALADGLTAGTNGRLRALATDHETPPCKFSANRTLLEMLTIPEV